MRSAPGRTLAWLTTVLGAALALRLAGAGLLSPPPLTSLTELTAWVDHRGPAAAAMSAIRLVAELTAWYVLAASVLHGLAGAVRSPVAARAVDALTVPAARRLVHAGLGVGLVAAATVAPAAAGTSEQGTARMVPVLTPASDSGSGTATMRPAPAPDRPVLAPTPSAATPAPPAPTTWRVEPGDSFWTIATEVLADTRGRAPSDREVDPYWRAVVERNRPRLVDPGDPDLVHPGQVLELPPPPPAS